MYDRVAGNIVSSRGLVGGTGADRSFGRIPDGESAPEVGIGPVYPVFLQTVYSITGHRLGAVRTVQAILGALIAPLMWSIAARTFGPSAGRICGWLVAGSPPLIAYSGIVLTENLAVMLLALTVWLFLDAFDRRSAWRFGASGAMLGILILLREEMLVLLPSLWLLTVWKGRPRPAARHLAAYVMTALLIVGAYSIRNYRVTGRPILVTAHGGETLWISAKGWSEWHFDDPELRRLTSGLDYVQRNEALQHDAWRMIAAAPGRYLGLCLKRVPVLWVSSHTTYMHGLSDRYAVYFAQGNGRALAAKVLLLAVHLMTLALAMTGGWIAFTAASPPVAVWVLALPIATITLVHFFLFSAPRYQIPVLPFVLAFAALALSRHGSGEVRRAA